MRVLAHLSDVHFGRIDDAVTGALTRIVNDIDPDVVVVSGDLTQRARSSQFRAAHDFLEQLPKPQIVVPGNHDVPLYDVTRRFLRPLARYRHYISADLEPFFADGEIAIAGVNSARSLTLKGGRINTEQVERACAAFARAERGVTRIVVTHHPFDLAEGQDARARIGRAAMAMQRLGECGVDVCLAGHLHVAHAATSAFDHSGATRVLVVQAGTASSTRGRGEANSFNVLRIDAPFIDVERYAWDAALRSFAVARSDRFAKTATGWTRR